MVNSAYNLKKTTKQLRPITQLPSMYVTTYIDKITAFDNPLKLLEKSC